jgi:hypothetical protein
LIFPIAHSWAHGGFLGYVLEAQVALAKIRLLRLVGLLHRSLLFLVHCGQRFVKDLCAERPDHLEQLADLYTVIGCLLFQFSDALFLYISYRFVFFESLSDRTDCLDDTFANVDDGIVYLINPLIDQLDVCFDEVVQ